MSGEQDFPLTLADWRYAYQQQGRDPKALLAQWQARLATADPQGRDPAWLLRCDANFIAQQADRLKGVPPDSLALWGVPFAVKDNIDVAGLVTTAACPEFAHVAQDTAQVVQRLMAAGAILVGKTNLDQFATGLVGTRSPYGEVPNSFDADYVSGGSSSGSASVVARGLVPFALGTDTAGSGRVPAGFNNLVGLKPTPGSVPMAGVLPACRTLDVVSVFALTLADASHVMAVLQGTDGAGAEPRFQAHALRPAWLGRCGQALRVGVPQLPGCDPALGYDQAFDAAVQRLADLGVGVERVDMTPFEQVARLLYDGPWVAERYTVVQQLLAENPDALDPTVRTVIQAAEHHNAAAAFAAQYQLESLRQQLAPLWQRLDLLMLPTAMTCPTRSSVAAQPVLRNSELGRYTNFVNLLGLSALALPASVGSAGLPFGVTFVAPGGADAALVHWGWQWEAQLSLPLGAGLRPPLLADRALHGTPLAAPSLEIAVVGAHLAGMPLHGQLLERGCRLVQRCLTAAQYRLFALPGTVPPKPGLARVAPGEEGYAIEVEVYDMPLDQVGSFLALIPAPLGLGSVQLDEGRWVKGFICEAAALGQARDISHLGGWRAYMASAGRAQ